LRYPGAVTRILGDPRTDPVTAATARLAATGVALVPSLDVTRCLGVGREEWVRFARHWEHLAPDPYAAESGVTRLCRFGQYAFRHGTMCPMPTRAFARPENSNSLHVGRDRDLEPLSDAFARDHLLHSMVKLLARAAAALEDVAVWNVKVHPFRIRSAADNSGCGDGRPTPEGLHRDGVTLVASLLVGRRNAVGGESLVCDSDGRTLLTTTLAEPGTLLLGDDRRPLHGASPVRPIDRSGPAQRDVLVITFASRWP